MDNNGDLWFCSYGQGVWKYDGKYLKQFYIQDGDEDVTLISIYEDRAGDIWLASDNTGLWRKEGELFKKFQ